MSRAIVQVRAPSRLFRRSKKKNGNYLAALDLMLDDTVMDIKSVTGHGWYSNIL